MRPEQRDTLRLFSISAISFGTKEGADLECLAAVVFSARDSLAPVGGGNFIYTTLLLAPIRSRDLVNATPVVDVIGHFATVSIGFCMFFPF